MNLLLAGEKRLRTAVDQAHLLITGPGPGGRSLPEVL